MFRVIAGLSLALMGSQISQANAQGSPATDNELYAGYCLGVSETIPTFALKLYGPSPLPPMPPLAGNTPAERDWNQKLRELNRQSEELDRQNQESRKQFTLQLEQQRQRFATYLMLRGVLLPMNRTDAFFGVQIERRLGQTETRNCYSFINSLLDQTVGSSFPPPPPICQRMARCQKPDHLP